MRRRTSWIAGMLAWPVVRRVAWLIALLLVGMALPGVNAGVARAQETPATSRRPMRFEDMMNLRRLGDIDVSPDGKWVMYAATDVDLEKNSRTSHLWIVPAAGGDAHALTASLAGESRGRFSPDGKQILYESARDAGQQIYLADFDGGAGTLGEAHRLTSISTEVDGAMWSPDGKSILFTSSVYPDCRDDACNKQHDEERAHSKVKARIFTELLYRHWNAFTGDKRSHLFLVAAGGGEPHDLTPGDTHDVPPFSLGGPDAYAFSPDSKELAFEENLDPVPAISTNVDIFTLDLTNPGARPVKISTSAGGDFSPAYSPDGKYIAWRSQQRAGYESDKFRLVLYDRQAKTIKDLLPKFDRWVDEFVWAPDSQTIYFAAGNEGEAALFSFELSDIDGTLVSRTKSYAEYGDLHLSPDGSYLFASRMTVQSPPEIFSLDLKHSRPLKDATPIRQKIGYTYPSKLPSGFKFNEEKLLTHLNTALMNQLEIPEMTRFWFPGAGRTMVQGFVIKPPAFDASKKYPLKFLIHGGPEGAWGDSWSYRWNAELLAANGYVVVMINPRGSTGYGQAFVDGVNGDWGGRPYADLMRGLDYAEQHYSFIDKDRECALGASYGGYMANWILGHTDRFKCIVSHDGMFDPESAYGTTEELWFNEWEFQGKPWDYYGKAAALDPYRKWAPSLAAKNFKTPTLVVHSQLDYRLDVSEGYQLFTTLQRLKVPSKMLYFPDEGHWVAKPQNSRLWYQTVNEWVDQWTKQGTKQ